MFSDCRRIVLLEPMLSSWEETKCLIAMGPGQDGGWAGGTFPVSMSEREQRFTAHAWFS